MTSRILLDNQLAHRILVLDGAMGTMIQSRGFKGPPDFQSLERPDVVSDLHNAYLDAGADIVRTNTFSSTSIVQADHGLASRVYDLNFEGARLARAAADLWSRRTPDRPRFVAGTIGPLNKKISLGPSVDDTSPVTFERACDAFREQARGLLDGGVHVLLLETIFDNTNAQAAMAGVVSELVNRGVDVPMMISATTTSRGALTICGDTLGKFYESIRHKRPFSVGLNCSSGAARLVPLVKELSQLTTSYVSCHPSAGLPNARGGYDDSPAEMADQIRDLASHGLLNIVGGCCGTTPEHIRAIADAVRNVPPRGVAG